MLDTKKTPKKIDDETPEPEDKRTITMPYKEWLEWKVDKEIARRKKEEEKTKQEAEEEEEEDEQPPQEKEGFTISDII